MKIPGNRVFVGVAALVLTVAVLVGMVFFVRTVLTGGDGAAAGREQPGEDPELMTIDVFAYQSNYQGLQGGWFGKLVRDRFNMELNIISPNISGGGDTLYQARAASGNLGDLIIIDKPRMKACIESGIVLDLTDAYGDSTFLKEFDASIQATRAYMGVDRIYALSGGSTGDPHKPVFERQAPYVGSFMRLDLYNELQKPDMTTSQDMLDVLQRMQRLQPVTQEGKRVYAFSLFKDWDGNYMAYASKFAFLHGYVEGVCGMLFPNADATRYTEVTADDGVYLKALRILFEANRMGLVDPDSSAQNWDAAWQKMADGQTLFTFWPWHAEAFNTQGNKDAGKGMVFIPVGDQRLVGNGHRVFGDETVAGIGLRTGNPRRVFDFVDWLASSEFAYCMEQSNAGLREVNWVLDEGKPRLTPFGVICRDNPDTLMPESHGGGTFRDGRSMMNFGFRNVNDLDPETGEPYAVASWSSVLGQEYSRLDSLYEKVFGARNAAEYLMGNGLIDVLPGTGYSAPPEETELATKRTQCGGLITRTSWQMIFADDEQTFQSLWTGMKAQLKGLGYEDVLRSDHAKLAALREAVQSLP